MINEQKMDKIMLELGHPENLSGTSYLRCAIRMADATPGWSITKHIYPGVARLAGSTPARVERCMRHSIQQAWARGGQMEQLKWFGFTVDPNRGCPTVGEYVARMARLCREEIEI